MRYFQRCDNLANLHKIFAQTGIVMDKLQAMQAFVSTARRNGFSAAAAELGTSTSSVTRLVAGLEAHLGVTLLQRTTRRVGLTEAGLRYLAEVEQVLGAIERAEADVMARQTTPSGSLVVSAPVVFGRLHLTPVLAAYRQRYPAVDIDLRLSDRMVDLVEERVDVALRLGHLANSTLAARRVGATSRILVASPDYLARHGAPASPREVADHQCIQFSGLVPGNEWTFYLAGRPVRVPIRARVRTDSAESARTFAELGAGLALILAYQATEALNDGRLVRLLPHCEPSELPIQVVYPGGRPMATALRAFIDMVVEGTDWRFTGEVDSRT